MQDFKNPKEIIKAPQNILYTVPINITRSRISFFNEMIKSHLRYEKHKKKTTESGQKLYKWTPIDIWSLMCSFRKHCLRVRCTTFVTIYNRPVSFSLVPIFFHYFFSILTCFHNWFIMIINGLIIMTLGENKNISNESGEKKIMVIKIKCSLSCWETFWN